MEYSDGFVPILAIFYAVFHPTEGTKILHQAPAGTINSSNTPPMDGVTPLFNFDTVKNYVIPKPQLCDRLISFKIDRYRVLGYPVNIQNSDYARNSFNFNFCFVFPYDSDTTPYELCIRRIGKMFRVLEEQSFMLSKLDKNFAFFQNKPIELQTLHQTLPGQVKTKKISLSLIELLIQQIFQDLNNYLECCIPLDSANSVDIKLFPILPPPVNIKAFQVPITTVNLQLLVDVNWDPTMLKILPFINGLNSIRRISELADSDYLLTKQCIQHLMHYKCIEILDIFQFSNIYAPTNHIGNFLRLGGLAVECQAYVITDSDQLSRLPAMSQSSTGGQSTSQSVSQSVSNSISTSIPQTPGLTNSPSSIGVSGTGLSVSPLTRSSYFPKKLSASANASGTSTKTALTPSKSIGVPTKTNLFYLYRSLNQGQTIKEWYIQHRKLLVNIDIRRFINFGVLHGLIYRVLSFPILNKSIDTTSEELNELMRSLTTDDSKKHRISSTLSFGTIDGKYMKNTVNETNLKTGKSKRKVSFNYNVEKPDRYKLRDNSDQSDDDDDETFSDLDIEDPHTTNGANGTDNGSKGNGIGLNGPTNEKKKNI